MASGPLLPLSTSVAGLGGAAVDVGSRPADPLAMVQPGNGPSGGIPSASRDQAVSADGRWVAFASDADDLVAEDTNETRDLFLRELGAGRTTRIPWLDGTQLPSGLAAAEPAITARGDVVAFTVRRTAEFSTVDPDLEFPLIAIYDRESDRTTIAPVGDRRIATGTQPSLSGHGRYLAYTAGGANGSQVVLVDRASSAATVISRGAAASARDPSVSDDGRFVAFTAPATVGGAGAPATEQPQVYRFDRTSGQLTRLSVTSGGQEPDGGSFSPSISEDGSAVAFASTATNLVDARGLDGTSQIYIWQQSTGQVRIVSTDRAGSAGHGTSLAPSISANGRFVAFQSAAPDLEAVDVAPASTGEPEDLERTARPTTAVFVRDIVNGQLVRASVDADGNEPPGDSGRPSISGSGMVVAYDSTSATLVPGDTNRTRDVFIRVWSPKASVVPDPLDLGPVVVGDRSGAGVVAVVGGGWAPFRILSVALIGPDAAQFELSRDGCSEVRLYYRDSCPIEITFSPAGLGSRSATVVIEDTAPGSPHSVTLIGTGVSTPSVSPSIAGPSPSPSIPGTPTPGGGPGVPGGGPTLVLDPPLGPPGFVTAAIGTGFPPGARVSLLWDQGINAGGTATVVGGDGTFRVGVLVFPKSAPGPRELVASSVGGTSFTDATAAFLVVAGTAQPPASGAVHFISPEVHPIITRP